MYFQASLAAKNDTENQRIERVLVQFFVQYISEVEYRIAHLEKGQMLSVVSSQLFDLLV